MKKIFVFSIGIILLISVIILKDTNYQQIIQIQIPKNVTMTEIDLIQHPNDIILKFVNLPFDYSYGSNSIPLVVASLVSSGDFLELGMGRFSTPLLHKLAVDTGRQVVSIDTDFNWVKNFLPYNKTMNHKVYCWKNFQQIEKKLGIEEKKVWGIVLIDHINARQRAFDAKSYADKAEIVLVHDSEKTVEHGYQFEKNKIREPFKYVCKFSVFTSKDKTNYVSTLLLSNNHDFKQVEKIFDQVYTDNGHISCDSINY